MQKHPHNFWSFLLVSPIFLSQLNSVPGVPNLTFPESLEVLDNGCHPVENEIVWGFNWSEIPDATSYHLYVSGANAIYPVIDHSNIQTPDYVYRSSGHIIDSNRMNWRWSVRARVNGEWGEWSEPEVFHVEPLNTDCPGAERSHSSN